MKSQLLTLSAIAGLFCISFASEPEIREHTEIITTSDKSFEILVNGSLDPENIEITIENIGGAPVVNPRITVNGKYNWHTVEDLAAEITEGCGTDQEKAMAVFDFVVKNTYWWTHPSDITHQNPVRLFNVYGYHICSTAASQFVALCRPDFSVQVCVIILESAVGQTTGRNIHIVRLPAAKVQTHIQILARSMQRRKTGALIISRAVAHTGAA